MITPSDALNTLEFDNHFVIYPNNERWNKIAEDFLKQGKAKSPAEGFGYNSGENAEWLSAEQIRELIKEYIDKDFKPL
jgi:hypothetical protein